MADTGGAQSTKGHAAQVWSPNTKRMQCAEREVNIKSKISQGQLGVRGGMVQNKWGQVKVKSRPKWGERSKDKCRGVRVMADKLGTNSAKMTDFYKRSRNPEPGAVEL